MRAFFQKAWYQTESIILWFLFPLSWIYHFLFLLRKSLYTLGVLPKKSIPVPLIVVGNITVGGTGKTPVVIALVSYLQSKGFHPGVVSRGYGGAGGGGDGFPLLVSDQSSVIETGDEPMLIFKRTGVPIIIDPKRSRAAELLAKEGGCDVIISDDGLQHYGMDRDFEIIVIDGQRIFGNKKLLPVGPLREPIGKLRRSDLLVVNTPRLNALDDIKNIVNANEPLSLVSMELETNPIETVSQKSIVHLNPLAEKVHAVAGIGNPDRFFTTLENLGFTIIRHAFDDHYHYQASDIEFADDLPVIMTEKDAIKCSGFDNEKLYFLPISAQLDEHFFATIDQFLQIN